jgi:hypothetical protein
MKMNVICHNFSIRERRGIVGFLKHLHAILQLRYEGILGYEGEELALHGIGERDNEQSEDGHLKYQEREHLGSHCVSSSPRTE